MRNKKENRFSCKFARRAPALAIAFTAMAMVCMAGCQDEKVLENQQAFRQLGINKLNEGSYQEAVDAFQKALDQSQAKVGDMEIDICYYKATAQYKSGDTKGALTTCKALVDYDKKNAKAYYLRGCIYMQEGDKEHAMEDFRQSFQISGGSYGLYVAAFDNLKNAGWDAEAEEVLEMALKLKPDKPEDYRERGRIYLLQGDYGNAQKELDQAINQKDVKALLYLAQVYEAQGNSKQAESLYENYISQNNSDVSDLVALGDMQMETGNYSQALAFYEKALTVEGLPEEQRLRRNEIIACEQMLDFEAAREKMVTYLKDYPDDEKAQREYVFLQTR